MITLLVATLVVLEAPKGFIPEIAGYRMVWSDEFSGATIDPRKWAPWVHGVRGGATTVADAASLDGKGRLWISTKRIAAKTDVVAEKGLSRIVTTPASYTTGGLWTRGLFEPRYGFFEARIMFQRQPGHWGAFWLNTTTMGKELGNPVLGVEIDVVERGVKLGDPKVPSVAQTLHWDGYGEHQQSRFHRAPVTHPEGAFNDYGVLWGPDGYRFFVNRKETWSPVGVPVSSANQFLILSIEVGGWSGDINRAKLPDSMIVDWVRVWQKPTKIRLVR